MRRLALLLLLALPACRAAAPADERTPAFTFVRLLTGPESGRLSADDNAEAFAGHFANMERMAKEGRLLVAGPYGAKRHDPALRGVFVLATADRAEAERWAGTDPTTRAGVFVQAFERLETDAPLAAAHARALARLEALRARGEDPAPGEGARGYVLLTGERPELVERELAPLRNAEGGVLLLGRLDGSRALALLDATTLAEARERFAPQLDELGPYVLDEWFASDELARMVD